MVRETLATKIKQAAREVGFSACGLVAAEEIMGEGERLDRWLADDCCAGMEYLRNHREMRLDPRQLVPGARTIISVALNYYPAERREEDEPYIAYYAYGKDYHVVMKKKLRELWEKILPLHEGFCYLCIVILRKRISFQDGDSAGTQLPFDGVHTSGPEFMISGYIVAGEAASKFLKKPACFIGRNSLVYHVPDEENGVRFLFFNGGDKRHLANSISGAVQVGNDDKSCRCADFVRQYSVTNDFQCFLQSRADQKQGKRGGKGAGKGFLEWFHKNPSKKILEKSKRRADAVVEIKRGKIPLQMTEEIFFAHGGEIPQRVVLQLKSKDSFELGINRIAHGGEYGRGKQRDKLPCMVDGFRFVLTAGGGLIFRL